MSSTAASRATVADTTNRTHTSGDMVGRTYLERGAPVVVLARWAGKGPRNVLIRRADGQLTIRPFRGLRRATHTDGGRP